MRSTLALCALLAVALVAGCGGDDGDEGGGTSAATTTAGTASADATAAVLEAYERLRSGSYRATVEQTISYDAGDAPAQVAQALSAAAGTTSSEVEAEEGSSRARAIVDSPQIPRDLTVVLYDGETFIAVEDGPFTKLGGSLGDLFADLADIGSEELSAALEDVRDEGPATFDGQEVQRYSASLSSEFTDRLTSQVFQGLGVDASQVDLDVTEATLEIDLLPDGGLVHQRSTAVIEIDLSQIAGEDARIVQTTEADQVIRDAGAAITVQQPTATREVTTLAELGSILS